MSEATCKMSTRPRSRGFTLLEVLIALVVLSIGLLGIAALQGVGLRSSHGAQLTSQASVLAYDLADRIRTNPDGFRAVIPENADFEPECPQPDDPVDPDYSPINAEAEADIDEWICSVSRLLPGDVARIIRREPQLDNSTIYRIRVQWEDLQSEGTPWDVELVIRI